MVSVRRPDMPPRALLFLPLEALEPLRPLLISPSSAAPNICSGPPSGRDLSLPAGRYYVVERDVKGKIAPS